MKLTYGLVLAAVVIWLTAQIVKADEFASWYGPGHHGNLTASGEKFDMTAHTAAHRTLPFGTKVLVTNTTNGLSTVVRINDRGPFIKGRVIDLSRAAAVEIQMINSGVAPVSLKTLFD